MGFTGFLEKVGSVFTHKKSGADKIAVRINGSVEELLNRGQLVVSEGVIVGVTVAAADPMEAEKLEKMETSFELSPEKRQFLEFLLSALNSKNESFLRNIFLDYADYYWGEDSIKQSITKWPTVINDFMAMGPVMPDETSSGKISKKLQIAKEEGDFLSKKQEIYRKWKGQLKDRLKKKLEGRK